MIETATTKQKGMNFWADWDWDERQRDGVEKRLGQESWLWGGGGGGGGGVKGILVWEFRTKSGKSVKKIKGLDTRLRVRIREKC